MHRCLELAQLGAGRVAPNPMVGAALVHDGRVIGEGYHQRCGEAHAEVNCINSVSLEDQPLVQKSTLYVSLEPCSHYGKTPPCSDLIIGNRIPQVVIGCKDVFSDAQGNAGKGIQQMQAAGIQVTTGIQEDDCRRLNRRFFTYHLSKRPYVILKWAESANGRIAADGQSGPAERIHISNAFSNRLMHKWRSEEQAILVGKQTVLVDDPSLTTRSWPGTNPLRCIVDKDLSLPAELKIFDDSGPTLVFNLTRQGKEGNIKWVKVPDTGIATLLTSMHTLGIQSLLVEGGARLLQAFIEAGLWDEARVIRNESLMIDDGLAAPVLREYELEKKESLLTDTLRYFRHT